MARVFIIGSGFSVKAGAPLSRTVLPTIFSNNLSTDVLRLKVFLDEFLFPKQKNWIRESSLEEVLSRLDLIRTYKPYPNVNYPEVSHFEELLIEEFTKLLLPRKLNPNHTVYEAFIRYIKPSDSILSFNYDLVLEKLFIKSGKRYHYGLIDSSEQKDLVDFNSLFKLHGSINLYYCPSCGNIIQIDDIKLQENMQDIVCIKCAERKKHILMKRFIIAPTLFKSYTLPPLRKLWFKALETLSQARTLIFIGYSLPKADILTYQLLDFSRRLCKNPQNVYIVNGPRCKTHRFRQIYEKSLLNTGVYFEEWISNECSFTNRY